MTTAGIAGESAVPGDTAGAVADVHATDVIVIGGVPSGSTAATLLALRLFRVPDAVTALGMWSNAWRHRRHAHREAALPFDDDTLAADGP